MELNTNQQRILYLGKTVLFSICAYSTTPFSENPNYRNYKHLYSDLTFLYFTNISAYLTLITVIVGCIYRLKNVLNRTYNTLIPFAFTCEFIVTSIFWGLYAINPELIVNKITLTPGYETPILTQLGVHLFPFILLILDQLDVEIVKDTIQPVLLICFLLSWYTTISIVAKYKGKYIYGFLNLIQGEFLRLFLFTIFIALSYSILKIYLRLKISPRNDKKPIFK